MIAPRLPCTPNLPDARGFGPRAVSGFPKFCRGEGVKGERAAIVVYHLLKCFFCFRRFFLALERHPANEPSCRNVINSPVGFPKLIDPRLILKFRYVVAHLIFFPRRLLYIRDIS